MGEGEKEKREGERVMIKLHCEPSCVLSLRAKQQLRPEGLGVQRSRQKRRHWTGLVGIVSREHLSQVSQKLEEHTTTCRVFLILFCSVWNQIILQGEKKKAGQRSKPDPIHLLLGFLHSASLLVRGVRPERLIC